MADTNTKAEKPAEKPKDEIKAAVPGDDGSNVEYVTVKTTGEFMLIDPYTGDEVKSVGESKVRNTTFIQNKLTEGQLELA